MAEEKTEIKIEDLFVDLTKLDLNDRKLQKGFLSKVLNENTLGKQGGMCVLFGAPTGVGKTTFTLMEIAKSLLLGKKVLYYTTEMDPRDAILQYMRICNKEKVEYREETLKEIVDRLIIIDQPLQYDIFEKLVLTDVDEFYIDYLDSSMVAAKDAADKSTVLNRTIRELREFAKEYNKFIWVCAQAKYLPQDDYSTDSFRESTAMCNAATLALIMHKRRQGKDEDTESQYVLEIVKNRHMAQYASTGTKIYFDTHSEDGKFRYIERGYSCGGERKLYKYYESKGKEWYTELFDGKDVAEQFI